MISQRCIRLDDFILAAQGDFRFSSGNTHSLEIVEIVLFRSSVSNWNAEKEHVKLIIQDNRILTKLVQ